jgi:hypothetical protein
MHSTCLALSFCLQAPRFKAIQAQVENVLGETLTAAKGVIGGWPQILGFWTNIYLDRGEDSCHIIDGAPLVLQDVQANGTVRIDCKRATSATICLCFGQSDIDAETTLSKRLSPVFWVFFGFPMGPKAPCGPQHRKFYLFVYLI